MNIDGPDCALPDAQCPLEPSEQVNDVKHKENHLVTISEQIVIDVVRQVIQMLRADSFTEYVVHYHITD